MFKGKAMFKSKFCRELGEMKEKNIVCNFFFGKIATFQAAVVQGTFSLG